MWTICSGSCCGLIGGVCPGFGNLQDPGDLPGIGGRGDPQSSCEISRTQALQGAEGLGKSFGNGVVSGHDANKQQQNRNGDDAVTVNPADGGDRARQTQFYDGSFMQAELLLPEIACERIFGFGYVVFKTLQRIVFKPVFAFQPVQDVASGWPAKVPPRHSDGDHHGNRQYRQQNDVPRRGQKFKRAG